MITAPQGRSAPERQGMPPRRRSRRAPKARGDCASARLRRRVCGRECRCRCSRRRAWRLRRSEREEDAKGWGHDAERGRRAPWTPNRERARAATRQAGRGAQAGQKAARSLASAAAPGSPAGHPAGWWSAAAWRSKRSGGQRLSLGTRGGVALSRLLLHLLHLRRDRAGLAAEGGILGVMLLELGDRLVRERAPVLIFLHVRDQRRLGTHEAG